MRTVLLSHHKAKIMLFCSVKLEIAQNMILTKNLYYLLKFIFKLHESAKYRTR